MKKITIYTFYMLEKVPGLEEPQYYISGKTEEEATKKLINLYGDNKEEILKAIEDGHIVVSILEYD